jgi:hypothetical protein
MHTRCATTLLHLSQISTIFLLQPATTCSTNLSHQTRQELTHLLDTKLCIPSVTWSHFRQRLIVFSADGVGLPQQDVVGVYVGEGDDDHQQSSTDYSLRSCGSLLGQKDAPCAVMHNN